MPESLTLYDIADTLPALMDTWDMTAEGSPERAECEDEIRRYMAALPKKVDSVAQVLAHYEAQVFSAGSEISRLQKRKARFEKHKERLEAYILGVLDSLPDPRYGLRRLEGNLNTLVRVKCPPSLDPAMDKAQIPQRFLNIIPAMEASTEVDNQAVKKALLAGESVPGARLKADKYRLRVD